MPETFDGLGLSFLYPDSWTVEQQESADGIALHSTGSSFMMLTDCGPTLESAFEECQKLMAEEFEEIERSTIQQDISGHRCDGLVQRFVYLDLIVTSTLLRIEKHDRQLLVQIQGEDRELSEQQAVFDAVLTSMLQSIG